MVMSSPTIQALKGAPWERSSFFYGVGEAGGTWGGGETPKKCFLRGEGCQKKSKREVERNSGKK